MDRLTLARRALVLAGIVGAVLLCSGPAHAVCTGANPTWSCTSWADMKTLVEGATIQSGATVTLAAGTHTFTGLITVPNAKRLTITGAGGTCAARTGTCATKISASSSSMFALGSSGSRIANFEFNFSACTGNVITVKHTNWRVDHNRVLCPLTGGKYKAVWYSNRGCFYPNCLIGGLIDSNYFQNADFYVESTGNGVLPDAQAVYAAPFSFGDNQAVYVEDNTILINTFGHVSDVSMGGAYVLRFNNLTKSGTKAGEMIEGHGLMDATALRGPRRFEVYWNTGSIGGGTAGFFRGGTGVIWGNRITASGSASNTIRMDHRRTPGAGDGSPACDGTQPYDSNEGPADAPGWLCRDQIGAGYDVTPYDGTLPFSAQYKSPMYSWDNGDTTVYVVSGHTAIIKADRDWYNHSAAAGSPQTTGVRVGTKANMPAGCAPGVGYWVTNEGYWDTTTPGVADGQLYKCTAPNTWTLYYIPYTYPHPLRSGVDPLPDPIPDPIPDAPAGTLRGISFGGVTW